ncbi:MAG: Methyltransferase type 11 [Anaerolineales bacterium]|nr:Methyltransferase type 11 [Anaerolineales bacterium]
MAGTFLRSRLAHPLTKGLSEDDPATTELRRSIIQSKASLAGIYRDWYREILLRLPDGPQRVLELGSGAGFLRSAIPQLITSDILRIRGVDVIADATRLPLADASLRAILMVNVFHHLMDSRQFLAEASRCIVPSGVICMVEPWVSCWSRQVYAFHSEPFDPRMEDWALPLGGPLTSGNGALPWIVFHRDRATLETDFPAWELEEIRPMMPFRYLLSGGVSMRQLAPSWAFGSLAALERALDPFLDRLAMFALIVLRRRPV